VADLVDTKKGKELKRRRRNLPWIFLTEGDPRKAATQGGGICSIGDLVFSAADERTRPEGRGPKSDLS